MKRLYSGATSILSLLWSSHIHNYLGHFTNRNKALQHRILGAWKYTSYLGHFFGDCLLTSHQSIISWGPCSLLRRRQELSVRAL